MSRAFPHDVLRSACALLLATAALAPLPGCSPPTEANAAAFTPAMNTYLAQRGRLCLAKDRWPIDVTEHEIRTGARNAVQLPVLEKLGLVVSAVADVQVHDDDGGNVNGGNVHAMKVRRYVLTDAGRRYWKVRDPRSGASDFCAADLHLARIVGWHAAPEPAPTLGATTPSAAGSRMVVRYTYRIDPAPWTGDPDAQRVFPVVAAMVRGAGTRQLEETFARTPTGWVAVDLLPAG